MNSHKWGQQRATAFFFFLFSFFISSIISFFPSSFPSSLVFLPLLFLFLHPISFPFLPGPFLSPSYHTHVYLVFLFNSSPNRFLSCFFPLASSPSSLCFSSPMPYLPLASSPFPTRSPWPSLCAAHHHFHFFLSFFPFSRHSITRSLSSLFFSFFYPPFSSLFLSSPLSISYCILT